MGSQCLMDMEFQFEKIKKFWRWMVVTPAQHCEYAKYHRTIHFKIIKTVNFVMYIYHYKKCTHIKTQVLSQSQKSPQIMWRHWNLKALLVETYSGSATLENCLAVPQMIKHSYHMIQQFHPQVYIQGLKTDVQTKTCTRIFTAALFTIATRSKQLKGPSTGVYINKMQHIHELTYESAMYTNKVKWCSHCGKQYGSSSKS